MSVSTAAHRSYLTRISLKAVHISAYLTKNWGSLSIWIRAGGRILLPHPNGCISLPAVWVHEAFWEPQVVCHWLLMYQPYHMLERTTVYRGACIITQLLYIMQIVMTDCAGHLTLLFICRYHFDASKFTFFETLVQNSFCTVFAVICSMLVCCSMLLFF